MPKQQPDLQAELTAVRARLEEAEETLRAIRSGEVDALMVSTSAGDQIYTLKGADNSYRVLVETINEGTATLAPGGDILYANTKLAQILGLPLEQVIGSAISSYIIKGDQKQFNALFEQAREGQSSGEVSLMAGSGVPVPAYLSLSSLRLEEAPGAVCLAVTDLTRQKRDEELVAEGRLSREILAQSEQAIAVCDASGRIIRASRGLHQICTFNPLFQPFERAFPLCTSGADPVSLDLIKECKIVHNKEMHFYRTDGSQVFMLVNAGPLLGENGKIEGCVVAFTDITERKRSEQERQNLIEELQLSTEELQTVNEELMAQAEELQSQGEELQRYRELLEQRVEERTAQLTAANERLEFLATKLITAQEEERRRISMELHDDLGQSLTLLKLQLHQLQKGLGKIPQAQERCQESLNFITELIDKVRRISQDLSPTILDHLGLSAALDHLFDRVAKYEGLKFSAVKPDLTGLFPMEAQVAIYRVFQEVLNNISKHAGATEVKVAIVKHPQRAEFIIADNGRGFDLEEVGSRERKDQGLGLAAMAERIKIIGGKFKLSSTKHIGTRISFTIPISSQ